MEEILEWKNKTEISFAFYANSRKFQPNEYGDGIVHETVEYIEEFDVTDKQLVYKLQKNQAESEESFLGLGISPKNQRTWFDIA